MTKQEDVRQIILKPVGTVRNSIRQRKNKRWAKVLSEIVLDVRYEEALAGIEDYSHIFVLFWLGRVTPLQKGMLKVHPRGRLDLPLVGIFSTRTQYRPNPIGLTLVELLKREKNVLRVRGLDALDGSAVIDIKPISPRTEFPPKSTVPAWYRRLFPQHRKDLPAR